MVRLAVQSRLVPGETLSDKREAALRMGFDGIELSGEPMIPLAQLAAAEGVPVTAICSGHRGWLIDPDPDMVRAARDDIRALLDLGAQLDAPLILVPIYGRNRKFPHAGTGRTPEEDEALWLEGLNEAARHAEEVGARILVEAINRYENSLSVTLEDADRYARSTGSRAVLPMGDVFHMNIEEADIGAALEKVGDRLGYLHLGDSQRLEPGRGHIDFEAVFAALGRIGYEGWASLECNLSGPAEQVLPVAVQFLRQRIECAAQPRSTIPAR